MYSDTQLEAFETIKPYLSEKRQLVLDAINSKGSDGATLFELTSILGWKINSISGRVTELRKLGLVTDSKDRRINPESGKKAIVWIVGAENV